MLFIRIEQNLHVHFPVGTPGSSHTESDVFDRSFNCVKESLKRRRRRLSPSVTKQLLFFPVQEFFSRAEFPPLRKKKRVPIKNAQASHVSVFRQAKTRDRNPYVVLEKPKVISTQIPPFFVECVYFPPQINLPFFPLSTESFLLLRTVF